MKISDIRDLTKHDILAAIGLEARSSTAGRVFGSLGIFTVGAVVGAAAALLLTPKTGQDLREDLGQRLRSLRETAEENADSEASSDDGRATASGLRQEIRP